MEEWLPVVGYEGHYSVSNMGRMRSETRLFVRKNGRPFTLTGRILVLTDDTHGYPKVELWKDGKQKTKKVYIAVAEAFIGPRPIGMEVCHNDGVPGNDRVSNLRYDTHKGNADDMIAHGTRPIGESVVNSKLTEKQVREIVGSTESADAIASRYGVCVRHVYAIRSKTREWRHLWV